MRLNLDQMRLIVQCVQQQFGAGARVSLFGSRLDDQARGGDVDLLVESIDPPTLRQRVLTKVALERSLQLPVDILAIQRGLPGGAFVRLAQARAQLLEGQA